MKTTFIITGKVLTSWLLFVTRVAVGFNRDNDFVLPKAGFSKGAGWLGVYGVRDGPNIRATSVRAGWQGLPLLGERIKLRFPSQAPTQPSPETLPTRRRHDTAAVDRKGRLRRRHAKTKMATVRATKDERVARTRASVRAETRTERKRAIDSIRDIAGSIDGRRVPKGDGNRRSYSTC